MASITTRALLTTLLALGMAASACQSNGDARAIDGAAREVTGHADTPPDGDRPAEPPADAQAPPAGDTARDAVARPDTATDASLPAADVAADVATDVATDALSPGKDEAGGDDRRDAPSSHDAAPEAPAALDGGTAQIDGSRDIDAPDDTRQAGDGARDGVDARDSAADSNRSLLCQGILVDNAGRPADYPAIYREETGAAEAFQARKQRLLSAYALTESDYALTNAPITWAASIEKLASALVPVTGPVDRSTTPTLATELLSQWKELFRYPEGSTTVGEPNCYDKFCMVDVNQDYCGLAMHSKDSAYNGNTRVELYATPIQAVYRIQSHFVPMVPLPRNVLLGDEALKQAVVGRTFTYACATGQHTATVTTKDQVTLPGAPMVYVAKSATAAALEYRLVVPALVQIGGLPWVVYVDGIDGTVAGETVGFICD